MEQQIYTDIKHGGRERKQIGKISGILEVIILVEKGISITAPFYLSGNRKRPLMMIEKMQQMCLFQI